MENKQESDFYGVWREVGTQRNVEWKFDKGNPAWKYDPYDQILRIRHVNLSDDVYQVRQFLDNWVMLTDITTHRVTHLQR